MPTEDCVRAMEPFVKLYSQISGQSALQLLLSQNSSPMPHDLELTGPSYCRGFAPELSDRENVGLICMRLAQELLEGIGDETGDS